MNSKTLLLILSLVAGISLLAVISTNYNNAEINTFNKTMKATNALEAILKFKGENPVLNDSMKGKIIVVNVWATWCAPCKAEIPELNKLVKEFEQEKVVFLALDAEDSVSETQNIKKQNIQFSYQMLFSQKELIQTICSFYRPNNGANLNAIPINIVINPQGKIEIFYVGYDPEKLDEVRNYLRFNKADLKIKIRL